MLSHIIIHTVDFPPFLKFIIRYFRLLPKTKGILRLIKDTEKGKKGKKKERKKGRKKGRKEERKRKGREVGSRGGRKGGRKEEAALKCR